MENAVIKNSHIKMIMTFLLPVCVIFVKPIGMTLNQSIIMATLLLIITWWATELVDRTLSSIVLLLVFTIFTEVPLEAVYNFPLSKNFILIVSSFLLSKGIINTGVAKKISNELIAKWCKNTKELVTMTFVIGIVLTFLIPHPFSRVILLSGIYIEMLGRRKIVGIEFMIIMFAVSVTSIASSMLLINGDVLLNYSAITCSGIDMTGSEWLKVMTLPALASYLLIWLIFRVFLFKNLGTELKQEEEKFEAITKSQKMSLLIMFSVIMMWFTEGFHQINSAYPALVGVILMVGLGMINLRDHRAVNYRLMVFLTAIFAVGKVLIGEGIAQSMSGILLEVFPNPGSVWYLIALVLGVIMIHLLIGSALATMSVITVPLVALTTGVLNPVVVAMLIYLILNTHFILPMHNSVLLIGYGEKHFDTSLVAKYGGYMTAGIFLIIYGLFLPWWRLIGLL